MAKSVLLVESRPESSQLVDGYCRMSKPVAVEETPPPVMRYFSVVSVAS